MRPAQRNPAEFHKYRSKKKVSTHYKNRGKKSYTKTDNIMVPDLAMLWATAKRSVEVSVVFAKFESLQFTLTIHSAAIRLCICPTVPSPAGQSDPASLVYGYTDGFGGLECFRMASVCLGGSLLESVSSLLKQAERRL